MGLEYFKAFHSYLKSVEPLNDAECGRLFKACLMYSMTGVTPDLRGNERFIFPTIQANIDRDIESYRNAVEIARANGRKGGRPRKPEETEITLPVFMEPEETEITQDKEKDKDKEEDKECIKENKHKRKNFIPPTVEEVRAYCRERGNNIDPQAFVDFYASKGWKVGSSAMKDWKAAVRTWEGRDRNGRSAASSAASGRRISAAEKKWGIV